MLSHILQPLITSDIPRSKIDCNTHLRDGWYKRISDLQVSVLEWSLKKTKHVHAGYPLIVDLWCLEDDKTFYDHSERVVKTMIKALKQKETKVLGVKCLIQCAQARLYRSRNSSEGRRGLEDILLRITKALISTARKGTYGSSELQVPHFQNCILGYKKCP